MIPSSFDYLTPFTVDEAIRALAERGEDAKVLAGGQSLLPVLRLRLATPSLLVDIGRISELRGILDEGSALRIGAMTTHYDVMRDPLINEHARLIALTTATVADPQIRHRGTFGGSLAHADPAGDLGGAALVHGATMTIAGPSGTRDVAAADFFVDYLTTVLAENEVLVSVRLPKLGAGWGTHYEKFNRVAQ